MKRVVINMHQKISNGIFTFPLLCGFFLVLGCGPIATGKKDRNSESEKNSANTLACGESSHDPSASTFRLKGAALLAQTFQQTLAEGATIDPISGDDMFSMENIASNFGNSKSGMYADIKSPDQAMTQYVMSLNYVGRVAALNCSVGGFKGKCKCDTEDDAAAMLQRAITFRRFCPGEDDSYVKEFAALCAKNSVDAISMLMTSIAVGLLQ